MTTLRSLALILTLSSGAAWADAVITEIHYNPPDDDFTSGSLREFVELYNPGPQAIDLAGYMFTNGITYTFPEQTVLEADAYLVLARTPNYRIWRGLSVPVLGPNEGKLDDSGERLTLKRPDGTPVDSVKYNDKFPWPLGADGYGRSLERIAWDLPADDFHSWRASVTMEGTPGRANSVTGISPRPVVTALEISPAHPTSGDDVTVRAGFDAPGVIESATLQWEKWSQPAVPIVIVNWFDEWRYHPGLTAPTGGDGWTEADYDDSSWAMGQGGIGYGEEGIVLTNLDGMRNNYSTVYIRKRFHVDDPTRLGALTLEVYVDDGYVCYINGREAARDNAPGVVEHDSLAEAGHEWYEVEVAELGDAREFLHPGENVIAVVGLNFSLTSTDFVLAPTLYAEPAENEGTAEIPMRRIAASPQSATYEAVIPAQVSQELIRCNVALSLLDGVTLVLPHVSEPRPFFSYFVFDGEVESLLPTLWLFKALPTRLTESQRVVSGVAALLPGQSAPELFDGALVADSRNGQKVKFLKGAEFRGDRTINVIPEHPVPGSTAGSSSPHREHLAFWFMREMGVLSPRAEWFRVVTHPQQSLARQTQQLVVQQVNERFLEMNGRDEDGYLFKRNYVDPKWEPHTHKEEGSTEIDNLTRALRERNPVIRRENMESLLQLDELLAYTVASSFLGNWDGYHNNHWMYRASEENTLWEVIPWDQDKAWGYTDSNPMYTTLPVEFPLNGRAPGSSASREPGPVYGQIHKDEAFHNAYLQRLRQELTGLFSEEFLFDKIADVEDLLLEDLELLEEQTGQPQETRRSQILESNEIIRTYIRARRVYLDGVLPEPVTVENWSIY